jgi:integrase
MYGALYWSLSDLGLDPEALGPVDHTLHASLISLPAAWKAAYAADTVAARRTDLRRLVAWSRSQDIHPFADAQRLPGLVREYLVFASAGLSPASLRRAGGSLSAFLRGLGLSDEGVAERHRLTLRASNRQARARVGKGSNAVRLTQAQIDAMDLAIRASDGSPVRRARALAMFRIMRELMLRRSELCDFRLSDWDGEVCEMTIRHSKTDQAGQGAVFGLGEAAAAALRGWLMISGLCEIEADPRDIPLFPAVLRNGSLRRAKGGGMEPLTGRSVSRILKAHGLAAGVPGVCGHTLRRSVARILFLNKVDEEEIMMAGRWTSLEMMRSYVGLTPRRRSAAELMLQEAS